MYLKLKTILTRHFTNANYGHDSRLFILLSLAKYFSLLTSPIVNKCSVRKKFVPNQKWMRIFSEIKKAKTDPPKLPYF